MKQNQYVFTNWANAVKIVVPTVTVLLIELAMTKQTALESNLICGTSNQKLSTQCLVRVYTACTLLAHKSNNVLCSLPLLQRSTLFALHYYIASFIKSTVISASGVGVCIPPNVVTYAQYRVSTYSIQILLHKVRRKSVFKLSSSSCTQTFVRTPGDHTNSPGTVLDV